MRWWMVVLLGLLVVVVLGGLFGRSGDVDSARARELVGKGATLVDVRSAEEYAGGHVEGAINVPVAELGGKMGQIPKDRAVVVYCQSGMRSARAAGALKEAGYTEVYDLGAMSRW
jgi:phage shock protein E